MTNASNLIHNAKKTEIKLCNKPKPTDTIAIVINKHTEESTFGDLRYFVTDGDYFYRIQPTPEGFKFYTEFTGIIFLVY